MQDPAVDERANALAAFETLGRFLKEDGWHPQQLQTGNVYRMGFAGDGGSTTCYAQVLLELEILLIYVVAPVRVPEDKRQEVAEFITRANYGLRIGNFEMDFADGEVRFKSSLDFEGAVLETSLIQNALYPAVRTMDRYLPGLLTLIYGSRPAAEIIGEIESPPS
ncbi:MAG TPA: YbjN domain-containing protein [Anaerolineae bacterium]|nr:YbjN domain-containing protein [Anaerolineae bacterium]